MKKKLKVPKFKNEEAERAFWAKMNLADHFDKSDFVLVKDYISQGVAKKN